MPYSKKHLPYSSKRKKIKHGSSKPAGKTDGEQHRRKRNGKPSLLPGSWSLLPPKVESKPVPVERTWSSMYNIGEIVWAKAPKLPWWPAEVIKVEGEELVNSKKEKECMVVELFNETQLVRITNPEMVKKYDCPEREHIVTEGMGHEFFMFAVSCAGSGSTPTKMKLSQSNNRSPEKNDQEQQINNELTKDCRNGDLKDSDSKDLDTNPSKVEYHSTSQCGTSQSEQSKIDAQLSSGEIETNTQEMKLNKRTRSSRKKILFPEESKADMPEEDISVCFKHVNQTRKRKGSVDIAPSQTRKKTRLKRIHSDSSLNVQESSTTVETAQTEQDTPDLETTICEDQTSSLQKDNSVLELSISKHDMSSTSIVSSVAGEGNVKMRGVRGRKRGPKGKQNKSAKFTKKNAMNTGDHISSVQSFEEESENSNDGLLKIHYTPKHRRKTNQLPAEKSKLKDIATKSKMKKRGRPKRKVSPKNNSQDSGVSQEAHYRDGSSPVPLDLKDIDHNFPTCTDDGLIDGRSKLPTEYDCNKNSFMTESKYCASFDPNLCKDMCDSSESDEELPEGLTPIAQEPLAIDDIVWVKWTRCPHWPAVIKQIYRRRKRILKVSVLPIEPISYFPPKFTVRYYPGRVLPFLHPDKEKYMKLGETHEDMEIRKKIVRACETVVNYFSKKALGNLQPEDTEFFNNTVDKNSYQEDSEAVSEEGYLDGIQRIAEDDDDDDKAKSEEQDEDLDDVLFIKSENIENQDKKVIERYNKIRVKNMKLVDFCVSAVMKEYLLGIINGKKTSNRHYIYHHGTSIERNKLKNSGFGPIADDEQQELIVQEMIEWYGEAKNLGEKELPDIGYILDVWVPEAVILGLIKTKGYNRSRAMVIFEKGVSMTKTEKASLHVSMLNSLKNISEEERTLYKEKADDRMRAILYQHGIEYDPSLFANS